MLAQSIQSSTTQKDGFNQTNDAASMAALRAEFPTLERRIHGKQLIYFDNAASAQTPRVVLERMQRYYTQQYSNVHRGVHALSMEGTEAYEDARVILQDFLHAHRAEEIVFTRGTTESINLVARTFGETLQTGDVVVLTEMEHHANLVPWHLLKERKGIELRFIPVTPEGTLDLSDLDLLLSGPVKLLSFVHTSNTLGTINQVDTLLAAAKSRGITTLVDAAQAAPHTVLDVQALGCDFLTFSAHKVYGPMGAGVLYGRYDVLDAMPPFLGGGDMIDTVHFDRSSYAKPPLRFEAGTPSVADILGMAEACRFVSHVGFERIGIQEHTLYQAAKDCVQAIDGVEILADLQDKAPVLSLVVDGVHPHDLGTLLDQQGIAVRTGHHCTQPLLRKLLDGRGPEATTRISFGMYNTLEEVEQFESALKKALAILRG